MPPEFVPGGGLHLYLPLTILVCSIVQSLMGVGLLLFGTPTLLLLGMGFGEALAVLLPCSVTVNLCQIYGGLPKNKQAMYRIAGITLPMIFLGTSHRSMGHGCSVDALNCGNRVTWAWNS